MKAGWVSATLGNSCTMYQPKTITSNDLIAEGPYPVFGANGVIGRFNQYNHEFPQLMITCRGATCGTVNTSEPFSWITGNAMVVAPNSANISLEFMEYVLRGGIDIRKAITGAAQPQITRANLEPITFSYPTDLNEQRRIVDVLSRAEGIVRLHQDAERKTTELIPALFVDMFGDPASNPKGWGFKALGTVCLGGAVYGANGKAQPYITGSPRYVRITDILDSGDLNPLGVVSIEAGDWSKYKLADGDLLFARTGNTVGKCLLFRESYGECVYAGYLIKLRCNPLFVIPDYIHSLTKTHYYRKWINSNKRVAGQPNINGKEYSALPVPIPPLALQNDFTGQVDKIRSIQKLQAEATAKAQATFNSLLSQVFSS